MATMAEAIREALVSLGGTASREDLRQYVQEHYAGQWKPSTLNAHLYACAVNNPKAYIHHPHAERFLYRRLDGSYDLYDDQLHGSQEQWQPSVDEIVDGEDETQEMVEASISLERDVEDSLVQNLASLEDGLVFVERQTHTDVGRLDILARDRQGRTVAIELKVGEARDGAVGQILRYMGWFQRQRGPAVRGILVANDFPDSVRYAASVVPSLTLRRCRIHFTFEPADLASPGADAT